MCVWELSTKYHGGTDMRTLVDTKEKTREMLNEVWGAVGICGYLFDAGSVLEAMDPVAFRCEEIAWIDDQIEAGFWKEDSDGEIVEADR